MLARLMKKHMYMCLVQAWKVSGWNSCVGCWYLMLTLEHDHFQPNI